MATQNMLNLITGRLARAENEIQKILSLSNTKTNNLNNLVWQSYDGSGNNLFSPNWGMIEIALLRKSTSDYSDGISALATRGPNNQNPRIISNSICEFTGSKLNVNNLTDMTWAWGQFVDHEVDITETNSAEPANIITPTQQEDPNEQYPGRTIDFNRSVSVLNSLPRQQPNAISAFIDATNVYGFNPIRVYTLRALNGNGKLLTHTSDNDEDILIYNTVGLPNAIPTGATASDFFLAGDVRVNENVLLTGMHTLFLREHNRLCDEIVVDFPEYQGKDELIFQRARATVAGIMQVITYEEFLPALLGSHGLDKYQGYDPKVNASITTEFSTVGYRLGHTMLSPFLKVGIGGSLELRDAFFNPNYIQSNGVNQLLYGACQQIMQEIDGELVDDVRNFLFGSPTATNLLDLASINIQRGRDHGLPGYNDVREVYGLSRVNNFSEITSDSIVQNKLSTLYGSADYIDPWIGCIVEDHLSGAAVGPLVANIIKDQFDRLRRGDRFYYENNILLSEDEKDEIGKTKLSDVINRNTSIRVQDDVFHL